MTIRLLDPPLHEFLPKTDAEFEEMATADRQAASPQVRQRAHALHETNPMLGHRGCRLGITYPEIYEMQARAIFEAAAAVIKESGEAVEPEIMIPLIATKKELDILKAMIDRVGDEVMERAGVKVPYLVGTMIELPRAALLRRRDRRDRRILQLRHQRPDADRVRPVARRCGELSRRLSAAGIFEHDPFVTLDAEGVGELMRIAAERGRAARRRAEARHLRRAWRRPGLDPLLPRGRARLRVLLALSRADRPPRRGAGGAVGRAPGRDRVRRLAAAALLGMILRRVGGTR